MSMNVYLVEEDGDEFCIKAETSVKAVKICEINYTQENAFVASSIKNLKKYYHDEVLFSCKLIGELRN